MPNIEILLWVGNAILGGFAWFFKRELSMIDLKIKKIEDEVISMRTMYLPKDDFREFKQELKEMFEEIKKDIHALRNQK